MRTRRSVLTLAALLALAGPASGEVKTKAVEYTVDGVTLQGSMDVQKGKAPVLALIVGVIVGVAGGVFRIFNAGFHPWEMQLFPPGGYPKQWDIQYHAKVHYRYDPAGPIFHP